MNKNKCDHDQDEILTALNKAQAYLDQLPVGIPKCVRPALMDAMSMWLRQGGIPPFVCVDYGRAAVLVPENIDGPNVVGFMSRVMMAHDAQTCSHSFESAKDNIVVLVMTAAALYKLTAKAITSGDDRSVGEWMMETHYPEP